MKSLTALVLVGVLGFLVIKFPTLGNVAGGSASLIALWQQVYNALPAQKTSKRKTSEASKENIHYFPPLVIIILTVLYLFGVEAIIAITVFSTFGANSSTPDLTLNSLGVARILLVFATIPVAKFAASRIKSLPFVWILIGVAIFVVADFGIGTFITGQWKMPNPLNAYIMISFSSMIGGTLPNDIAPLVSILLLINFLSLIPAVFIGYGLATRERKT